MVQQCRRCGQMHDAYTGCTLAVRVARRSTVIGEDEALVGNIVADRYQIGDLIGVGSTGTVFGVEHVTFGRPAAMKVLRPRFADADLVSRVFHGEARAAWSVSHPCICEVFDIGTLPDGSPFFVMEHLAGETLAARIARERLSLASAVDVMMQMLSAIAAIHARDLLLRDLRPRNVYLAHRRGCRPLLKILDFGLARLTPLDRIQEEWDALHEGVSPSEGVGSTAIPYYLSPERTRGEHDIEPASDLFVAAVIFYEALAGERPFTSSSFNGVLVQIAQGKPVPLHERRPDVSPELSAFVSRALSANPRARPASAKEMQDELRAIFEGARKGSSAVASSAIAGGPSTTDAARAEESTFASIAAPPISWAAALAPKGRPRTEPPAHASSAPPTRPVRTSRPPSGSYERDAARPRQTGDEAMYEDETATQREALEAGALPKLYADEPDDELATEARRPPHMPRDEASADNAARTVPPPATNDTAIDVDVSFDDRTAQTKDRRSAAAAAAHARLAEDDETETMALSPELRARVDHLLATHPAPRPAPLPHPAPLPPNRGTKPPRRR